MFKLIEYIIETNQCKIQLVSHNPKLPLRFNNANGKIPRGKLLEDLGETWMMLACALKKQELM
jgi:hypothetical protein